ncbi:forkhead box protein G1-like [Cloeon dipterum]|uniref:forkhead box protein G1-like n=1 Tax=Cloeon dipterum TaxID=197152 RepID=UPI0032201BF0
MSRKSSCKHSYISLMKMAILSSSTKRMALREIYQFLKEKHNFSDHDKHCWQNTVRHTLSSNSCFVREKRPIGSGSDWTLNLDLEVPKKKYRSVARKLDLTTSDDDSSTDSFQQLGASRLKRKKSIIQLITTAIRESPRKMLTLSEIYQFLLQAEPSGKVDDLGKWQNYVRHALSKNECFVKVPRPSNESGCGCYWALNPDPSPNCRRTLFKVEEQQNLQVQEQYAGVDQAQPAMINNFEMVACYDESAAQFQPVDQNFQNFMVTDVDLNNSTFDHINQELQQRELSYYDDPTNYIYWFNC